MDAATILSVAAVMSVVLILGIFLGRRLERSKPPEIEPFPDYEWDDMTE